MHNSYYFTTFVFFIDISIQVQYTANMTNKGRRLSVEIGLLLAEKRKELGYTQSGLAEKLRIQRTSISNIESGKQVILVDLFYDICQSMGISAVDILKTAVVNLRDDIDPQDEINIIVKEHHE